jgi:hypothetical protein
MSALKPCEYFISRGDEPRVYQAFTTDDLMGYHGGLMAEQLRQTDQPLFMLYAPIWQADSAPFGFAGRPASHGLAVTASRFVITRNFHTDSSGRGSQVIPFFNVLCIHVGTAHLMGWFAICHAESGRVATTTIFHKATGTDLFIEAIRAYRLVVRNRAAGRAAAGLTWDDLWHGTPQWNLVRLLRPLLLDGEQPLAAISLPRMRNAGKRSVRASGRAPVGETVLVETNDGIVQAVREPDAGPKDRGYGLNFTCAPRHAIHGAMLVEPAKRDDPPLLRLTLVAGGTAMDIDVPFDQRCRERAVQIVGHFRKGGCHA